MAEQFEHIPVLLEPVLEYLTFPTNRPVRLIDGTLGGAGHSSELLSLYSNLELLGIDRDDEALAAAKEKLSFAKDRVHLERGDYGNMKEIAASIGWDKVDGILLDIGVSSHQIDSPERGFSFRFDAPLDMRMDRRSELTAARVLARYSENELFKIFRDYGEIRNPRKLVNMIVSRRVDNPIGTTGEFAEICEAALGRQRPGGPPVATLPFQALRIVVNDELGQLESALKDLPDLLNVGVKAAIISFHSLEDRIVKESFREQSTQCICPPGLPICCCNHVAVFKQLTKKVVVASSQEVKMNRRSACAKMRVVERI